MQGHRRLNKELTFYHTIPIINDLEKKSLFKPYWEKEENAGNQHFLLFPQCIIDYSHRAIKTFPPGWLIGEHVGLMTCSL